MTTPFFRGSQEFCVWIAHIVMIKAQQVSTSRSEQSLVFKKGAVKQKRVGL